MEGRNNFHNLRLSIIIPVYNAEAYLERCVKSCLAQGVAHNEYEILLCNDGSTDGSLELANKLSAEHVCIKVFSQDNAGAGMARNLGLSHATGDYVVFVDSDDYLVEGALAPLLQRCEELQLDICKYVIECIILDTGKHIVRESPIETDTILTGDNLLGRPEVPLDSACSSLYRRRFLEENNLRFGKETSSEDVVFSFAVYQRAQRIIFSNTLVYTYEVKVGSRGHSTDYTSQTNFLKNNIRNAGLVYNVAHSNDLLSEDTRKSLQKRANSMIVGALMELYQGRHHIFTKDAAIKTLELARQLGIYPIKGRTFTWKSTLLAHLFLNCKSLFLSRFN